MTIDRQRITTVDALLAFGYEFAGGQWFPSSGSIETKRQYALVKADDGMCQESIEQYQDLVGCPERSPQHQALERLAGLALAYEAAHSRK